MKRRFHSLRRLSRSWRLPDLWPALGVLPLVLAGLAMLGVVVELGLDTGPGAGRSFGWLYGLALVVALLQVLVRYVRPGTRPGRKAWLPDLVLALFIASQLDRLLGLHLLQLLEAPAWTRTAVFLVFVREFSALGIALSRRLLNPAQLFVVSFLLLVALGTGLLLLPRATHAGIRFVDALFTSTSAVCVTGLVVVDTGTHFTRFGQYVIMGLIQLGGLGIMTFASYFSYFFRGAGTFENQLVLRDMLGAGRISEVFSTLGRILAITFLVEALGAVLIYWELGAAGRSALEDPWYFATFHSVSAFCNAGFSTLGQGLYEPVVRFNYPLHLVVAALYIVGGIGFPIVFNGLRYLRHLVVDRLLPYGRTGRGIHVPWVIDLNTRIVGLATLVLLLAGTVGFLVLEWNNTLAGHGWWGKLVTAFFGSATARTAGFNTVDMGSLGFATVMLILLLMWIGASPGGTGGGIKTSTFAIATLNFFSVARGKDRLELFRREVSHQSVRRAFAIISLSLVAIGVAVFLIAATDPDKGLLALAFECFSAYSTVGLSLGITGQLSDAGKLVIVATMFVGRVGTLTLLTALLRNVTHLRYRYPSEEIPIN